MAFPTSRPPFFCSARSCRNPRIGDNPDPAQKSTSGTLGSCGGWNAADDALTAICTLSPGRRFARYVDATPRNGSLRPERAGASITLTVSVALWAFQSGEDEMEYCRILIDGRRERKSEKGSLMSEYCSRRSRTLSLLPRTCSP